MIEMTKQKARHATVPAPSSSHPLLSLRSFIATSTFLVLVVLHGYGYGYDNNHEKDEISPLPSSPGGAVAKKRNLEADSISTYMPKPKMNAKPITSVEEDTSPFFQQNDGSFVETLKSKVAYFTGVCSVSSPFEFSIGGKSGRGVIGTPPATMGTRSPETFVSSIGFIDHEGGDIALMMDNIDANFFPFSPATNFVGVPFSYGEVQSETLCSVSISCSNTDPVDIVVIVGDDEHGVVGAKATHALGSDTIHVELVGGAQSKESLRVDHIIPIAQQRESQGEKRHLRAIQEGEGAGSANKIYLQKEVKRTLESSSFDSYHGDDIGCTLIQIIVLDSQGKEVPRTIVVCSELHDDRRSRKLQDARNAIKLDSTNIDENGDVALKFASFDNAELAVSVIKLRARIGILSECNKEAIPVVEMNAMLPSIEPTLVVHGGWFRRATKMHEINCDWEPIVLDAVATDPNSKHTFLGRMEKPAIAKVVNESKSGNKQRHLLKASSSLEELNINEEMKVGRKPHASLSSVSKRDLEEDIHKKIIVHGYCSGPGNSFKMKHFTDAIEFSDPDVVVPEPSSWTVDEFARKIDKFAVDNDIHGCGVIAHSQGGMAALHLRDTYWSCLDNANGGGKRKRLIQSIGTPYQGTPLAGNIAAIGYIFGILCGYNYDLTEDGADAWLNTISDSSRSDVFYGRTYAETGFRTTPCLWASDLILNDPEDGVVESENAVLPGGRALFHRMGLCHISSNFPAQTKKRGINKTLNKRAKY